MSNPRSREYTEEVRPEDLEGFARLGSRVSKHALPALFLTRLRHGEFEILNQLGIALNEVLHGEQEYIYEPAYWSNIPRKISYFTELLSRVEKGKMLFLVFETQVTDPKVEQKFAISKTTMIVRRTT